MLSPFFSLNFLLKFFKIIFPTCRLLFICTLFCLCGMNDCDNWIRNCFESEVGAVTSGEVVDKIEVKNSEFYSINEKLNLPPYCGVASLADDVDAHLDLHRQRNVHQLKRHLYPNVHFVLVTICMARNFAFFSCVCKKIEKMKKIIIISYI